MFFHLLRSWISLVMTSNFLSGGVVHLLLYSSPIFWCYYISQDSCYYIWYFVSHYLSIYMYKMQLIFKVLICVHPEILLNSVIVPNSLSILFFAVFTYTIISPIDNDNPLPPSLLPFLLSLLCFFSFSFSLIDLRHPEKCWKETLIEDILVLIPKKENFSHSLLCMLFTIHFHVVTPYLIGMFCF